jgi:hypothetical protein
VVDFSQSTTEKINQGRWEGAVRYRSLIFGAALLGTLAPIDAAAQTQPQWLDIPCADSMVAVDDRLKCQKLDRAQTGTTESTTYRTEGVIEGFMVSFRVTYAGAKTIMRQYNDQQAERRIKAVFGSTATYAAYQSKGRTGWMQVAPSGSFGVTWKSCIGFTHTGPENHFVFPYGYYWDSWGYICRSDATPVTIELLDKALAAVRVGPAFKNTSAVDDPIQPFSISVDAAPAQKAP